MLSLHISSESNSYIGKDQKAQEEVIQGLSETRFTMIFSLLEDSDTSLMPFFIFIVNAL